MLGRLVIVVIRGVGVLGVCVLGVTLLEKLVLGVLGVFGKVLVGGSLGMLILGVFGVETDVLLKFFWRCFSNVV
jgi:hypothetical protein